MRRSALCKSVAFAGYNTIREFRKKLLEAKDTVCPRSSVRRREYRDGKDRKRSTRPAVQGLSAGESKEAL